MKLESTAMLLEFDPYQQSTAGGQNFGEVVKCADSRWFRFNKAVATNHAGYLQQGPTVVADAQNMTCLAAVAIGGTQVKVTTGTSAVTAGIYDEGYMVVNAGTGLGQIAKIKHNFISSATAALSSAGSAYGMIIDLFDPLMIALDTTSKISIVHNTYNNTQEIASLTARAAGVPLIAQTAANYGWLQTRGVAAVYSADGAGTTGVMATSTGSGAGGVINYATGGVNQTIGYFLYTAANGEYRPVFLEIG
ncbi:MAG: hypothetical protein WCJ81_09145 [bacterium]